MVSRSMLKAIGLFVVFAVLVAMATACGAARYAPNCHPDS